MSNETSDAYFEHTAKEHPQDAHGAKANPVILAGVLIATLLFTAVFVLITVVYYNTYTASIRATKLETTDSYHEFMGNSASDLVRINSYGWVDAQAGTIHIPIEQAMKNMSDKAQGSTN